MTNPKHLQCVGKALLTKKQAAEFFAVSERSIDRWLLDGTLPVDVKVTLAGTVRFRHQALLDHIDRQAGVADADRA